MPMMSRSTILAALLGAALLTPVAGRATFAQGAPAAPGASAQATVDQRIQALHTQLAITPQQEAQWDGFAQKMRENATLTERLAQQRASSVTTMSAVDNMRSYARISHEYANSADRLAAAFEALYATLTPAQKQAADTMFRQQPAAAPRG
jgi:protein CpxP